MKYAAIDIGTNSCRLLIAEVNGDRLIPVYRDLESTRLGEGLNSSRRINDMAMVRTFTCLKKFLQAINDFDVKLFRVVATSAVREASNQEEFIRLAQERCGISIEVIEAEEESLLSYLGVKKGLEIDEEPLVVDLGGGSTEFFLQGGKNYMMSLPLGAVRATESDMSAVEIAEILAPLSPEKKNFEKTPLVFVGGTASSLVAIKMSLETYSSELIHGQVLSRREIADIYNMLERLPLRLRKRLPGLQEERADIIPKGTLIILLIMDALEKNSIIVSESDLLDGVIGELYQNNK